MTIDVIHDDCLVAMKRLIQDGVQVDAIVTDPPYHLTSIVKRFSRATPEDVYKNAELRKVFNQGKSPHARAARGFMGKAWDGGDVAFNSVTWGMCYELLKPGGHLLAFGGSRTFGKLHWAVEGGGFEVRDTIAWLFGSGFPKSHDVSKAIDKMAGAEREKVRDYKPRNPKSIDGGHHIEGGDRPWMERARERGFHELDGPDPVTAEAAEWEGWGTALKPAMELVVLARKPLSESSIAANVLKHGTGALNIGACRIGAEVTTTIRSGHSGDNGIYGHDDRKFERDNPPGRWPANVCHDGSEEVLEAFAAFGPGNSPSRYFYSAKAQAEDRWGSKHPTVKPVDLMRWLVRLVTPPGGTVLDPFAGTGTTGIACMAEGFNAVLIEREDEYHKDIQERLAYYKGEGRHWRERKAAEDPAKASGLGEGLFAMDRKT